MVIYKKEKVHATVSPFIKSKAEKIVGDGTGDFSSMADFVSIAMQKLIDYYETGLYTPKSDEINPTNFKDNLVHEPKTEYTGSTLSRAQVLEKLVANLELQLKLAEDPVKNAATLALSKEAGEYLKELLAEFEGKNEEKEEPGILYQEEEEMPS